MSDENKSALKKLGLLTRDPRMVEKKSLVKRKRERNFSFQKDNFLSTIFLLEFSLASKQA